MHILWLRRWRLSLLFFLMSLFIICKVPFVYSSITSCAPTDQECITFHDIIPNFIFAPTIRSVKSGFWNDPTVWDSPRLPMSTDIVQISTGHTVTYNSLTGSALVLGIQAGAIFQIQPDINTKFMVETIWGSPSSTFLVGTVGAPVRGDVTARIVIVDQPLNTTQPIGGMGPYDPRQFGGGLVVVGGTVSMRGFPKTPFLRLVNEPQRGDTTLEFSEIPLNWVSGDTLHLPDTQAYNIETGLSYVYEGENVTIKDIDISGHHVLLTSPLLYTHPGARNAKTNTLEYLPHVANMTRNVQIESQNPAGTRGHILFTESADVHIENVLMKNLGRTTTDPLDNTTFNGTQVIHTGTNQQGRYPVHFHHVYGRLPSPQDGYQFTFRRNVIYDDQKLHKEKWAVSVHDSHYGLLQENIVVNSTGWGFGTEDGNESFNLFEHNFVSTVRGIGGRNTGEEGNGYWFRGPNNFVRRNIAVNVLGFEGDMGYGGWAFLWMFSYLGNIAVPNYQGADTSVPDQSTIINGNATPLLDVVGNESYGPTGINFSVWWLGTFDVIPYPDMPESIIKDSVAWGVMRSGYYGYPTNHLTLDGFTARSSSSFLRNINTFATGIHNADYMVKDFRVIRANIQGFRTGIFPGSFIRDTFTIEDSFLNNARNIDIRTPGAPGSSPDGHTMPPRSILIKNVLFENPPVDLAGDPYDITMLYLLEDGSANLIVSDIVQIFTYNTISGDDFQAFYYQQDPSFIVPQSSGNLVGSPEAGLTNQQNLTKYGNSVIAGAISPTTQQRPRIAGFVFPLVREKRSNAPTSFIIQY